MASIYIHIPFCHQACTYCDFHFITSLRNKEAMVAAIVDEIHLRSDFFGEKAVLDSIYFGGGTPSVLSKTELSGILGSIKSEFEINPEAEITLEANPDDLTIEKLEGFLKAGINRLSIGIQSFVERDLRWMNRSHNATQAVSCLDLAHQVGFRNISADLIFGIPGLTREEWEWNLSTMVSKGIPHLSLYALTVEEKTALAHQVSNGRTTLPEDETYEAQFLFAHQYLEQSGYEHYELSNYALPGMRSQHNSSYWKQKPYLGIGPSAHSYNGIQRMWNVANNPKYLQALQSGKSAIEESETLDQRSRYHEYIMTHLRKKEGISPSWIEDKFIPNWEQHFSSVLQEYLTSGMMIREGDFFRLTPEGWLISDRIISEFFLEDQEA